MAARSQLSNRPRRLGFARAIVAITFSLSAVLVGSGAAPAAGQQVKASACPEMTDSIRRIYLAYFDREPDPYEAFSWTSRYMNGEVSLPQIAGSLARSGEFNRLWGSRTSAEFVELVHLRTGRDVPDSDEIERWAKILNTGYSRGEMTVALTETEHYVSLTDTARPLSGYLRWYPPGTHWYCGSGPRSAVSVKPLQGAVVFVDRLVENGEPEQAAFQIITIENGMGNATLASGVLPARASDFMWSGVLSGDGFYGSALQISATESTRWVVVFYPQSIGNSRLGWQIAPD